MKLMDFHLPSAEGNTAVNLIISVLIIPSDLCLDMGRGGRVIETIREDIALVDVNGCFVAGLGPEVHSVYTSNLTWLGRKLYTNHTRKAVLGRKSLHVGGNALDEPRSL